ncbi:hypothetical protein D1BOALGB6SA_4608 [Olavius sp. associated proteobacterium Delta 1]|nr:hypothetical protein D1BOALGB6SA_4608 [Olavius sp. associated proteobacterium Delta 1]
MKRLTKTAVSDKIEANKDKIYRISDPIQLAEIFFPAKNAHQKRAAFLAILFEIKNAKDQKLDTTDHISKEYVLGQSSVTKARIKMSRIGLIRKRNGYWIFSSVFGKTLKNLITKIDAYQMPAQTDQEKKRERFYIEMAKNMN